MHVDGILFDKDGTLFDFRATWDVWAGTLISELASDDPDLSNRLAATVRYDWARQRFHPDSPAIAGTGYEIAECFAQVLPDADVAALALRIDTSAATAPLAPAAPLEPLLQGLKTQGLALGVMTNDAEQSARAHLTVAGVVAMFDFIAGYDSGYGFKPDPDPLLAFAAQQGLNPAKVVMVGDSSHDLIAGKRAGMGTLGVLTGVATAEDLAPYADAIVPNIGHIPSWLKTL